MKKIESGNELPYLTGEKMVRKKNLNADFHIKMGCMRTGQRLLLFSLERQRLTGRSICISRIVENGWKKQSVLPYPRR